MSDWMGSGGDPDIDFLGINIEDGVTMDNHDNDVVEMHCQKLGAEESPVVQTIGEGDSHGVYCHQDTGFTCAVVSQEMILKEFGIDVSETELAVEATEKGWLSTAGTPMCNTGLLLQEHGVACHQGCGMEGIVEELAQGHKVIVGVDSNELWGVESQPDWLQLNPNHALVLQGIRQHEDGSYTVVVNDPGDPEGAGKEYPLEHFADAANDSGFFYVATNEAPPDLEHDPVLGAGFNAETGHYDGVWDWLQEHGSTLHYAAGAVAGAGLGISSLSRSSSGSAKPLTAPRTEKERNDLLRKL